MEKTFTALGKEFKSFQEAKLYQIWANPHEFDDYINLIAKLGSEYPEELTLKQIKEMAAYYLGANNKEYPLDV